MSLLHTSALRINILLERLQGLDFTRANQQPAELGLDANEVFIPSPSGGKALRRVFADLNIVATDRVLDIGCAKGSAMRDLLRFPFAQVDGLELSAELTEIARRNFAKLGKQHVSVFCEDARTFARYGNYNIFYLYNPFPPQILDQVLAVLKQQTVQADPGGEQILIYNNPLGDAEMQRHGYHPLRRYPDFWGHGILVYSNRKSEGRLGAARV